MEKNRDSFLVFAEGAFDALFQRVKIEELHFVSALSDAITLCFHQEAKGLSKTNKAEIILDRLFFVFSKASGEKEAFLFSKWLPSISLKGRPLKSFLTALLYALFYREIDLKDYQKTSPTKNLEILLLSILANHLSKTQLKTLLKKLPEAKILNLIAFAFGDLREGSCAVISALEIFPEYKKIIQGLKSRYYDVHFLQEFLKSNQENRDCNAVCQSLENYAVEQVRILYSQINQLIPLIVNYPIAVFNEINKLKSAMRQPIDENGAEVQLLCDELKRRFDVFFTSEFKLNEYERFARIFGLEGHISFLYEREGPCEDSRLIDKLNIVIQFFESPQLLLNADKRNIISIISFAMTLVSHLEALRKKNSIYIAGLEKLTFAMPTIAKDLSLHSSLTSVLKGLKSTKIKLLDYPIYVFDQSDDALYQSNKTYIKKLNKKYRSHIVHVSSREVLDLSAQIEIESLIDTTGNGKFGYGGARNCMTLLTPFLRHLFQKGFKTLEAVLEISAEELKSIFKEIVLSDTEKNSRIYLLDDDMEIPVCNIFSFALLVEQEKAPYFFSQGFSIGRGTKHGIQFIPFEKSLKQPQDNFQSTEWISFPLKAGFSESVSCPRFCLNLPFGGEEGQMRLLGKFNSLLQPSIHLAGTRFPKSEIPSAPFVGLEHYLKKFIPYAIPLDMSKSLLDPTGVDERCALPWNGDIYVEFTKLLDVVEYALQPKVVQDMQERFWRNFREIFVNSDASNSIKSDLIALVSTDIPKVLNEFHSGRSFDKMEKASLQAIGELYRDYQNDAKLMLRLVDTLVEAIKGQAVPSEAEVQKIIHEIGPFEEYPLTKGLVLIVKAVGMAQFNHCLQRVISK